MNVKIQNGWCFFPIFKGMNISNRLIGYLLVIALFIISAIAIESNLSRTAPTTTLNKASVEAVLKAKIDSLKNFEQSFNACLNESVLNNRTTNNYFQKKSLPVGGSVFVFDHSNIVFWSDNKCPIDSSSYHSFNNHSINRIGNGYYYVDKSISENRTILYSLFIRSDFNIQNQYLENNYNSNLEVCNHRNFSLTAQEACIEINYEGSPLFYISA
ncbi:MAG: hypothetical protein ACKOX3_03815, partial [Bacteroidota bacterium]